MSADSLEKRTVVVQWPSGDVDEELLLLYFENRRRSGGSQIASVEKSGSSAVLVFEEAEAAARVLSKGHHVVHNVELLVRRPAAKDPRRLLLRGVNPGTSSEMIELYVENMMGLNTQDYTLLPAPGRDLVLIHLSQAFTKDFQTVSAKISQRALDGAHVTLEQIEQTDSILVENLHPGAAPDLLSLYFESSRGGGQEVKQVVMLSESVAKVSFANYESVDTVVELPHRLDGSDLAVKPYFDFLQPTEPRQDSSGNDVQMRASPPADVEAEEEEPMQDQIEVPEITTSQITVADPLKRALLQHSTFHMDLQKANPNVVIQTKDDGVHITGDNRIRVEQLKQKVLDFIGNMAETKIALQPEAAQFLAKKDVQDRLLEAMKQRGSLALYSVSDSRIVVASLSRDEAEQAGSFLKSQVCHISISLDPEQKGLLCCREWSEFLEGLSLCSLKVSDGGGGLDGWTLEGLEEEKQAAILQFLTTPIEREAVIPMAPGMLKYIQIHCHQLLADMNQVSILPLEGDDECGLKLHGSAVACQMAEELLQDVIASICTKTIHVSAPGLTRFLQHKDCLSIMHEMEAKFQVYISLQHVPWDFLHYEDFASFAWNMLPKSFPRVSVDDSPQELKADSVQSQNRGSSDQVLLNNTVKATAAVGERQQEIMNLTDPVDLDGMDDLDLYTTGEASNSPDEQTSVNGAFASPDNLEEEAQLSLAIQYSLQSSALKDDEQQQLQKALELSKSMIQSEVFCGRAKTDTQVTPPHKDIRKMSLEEAIDSANTVDLVTYAGYPSDLSRVEIAFNKKVTQRQVDEKVENRNLRKMSKYHWNCVQVIKRMHAVDVQVQGTIITVSGFKDFVSIAMWDVKKLLDDLSSFVPDEEVLKSIQWVWHDPASANTTPYCPDAILYIENAWKKTMSDIVILLDNEPHIIDFERMKEINKATGKAVKISRKLLNVAGLDEELPEEEYSLLSDLPEASKVDVDSDEFQDVVKEFYKTIHEFHSKIRIIQVEKIQNRLLYNQYKLKKASISQRATYPEIERTLYHGTSETSVKEICIHGFNRSFCGKNATVYGQGVYFAVNSSLSVQDTYSPPNADGYKYVFVCKVLTGDYTKGCSSMKTTPLKETGDIPLRYDSVTDNISKPSMFVIFNDTQAFPEYVITCQKIR
ncbi:protein mono-ADP-ribosyltransferase PARP10 [Salarias fasciatus]|uniref:protein mono-ADP-ribosyltransferase PARP10 n=1 Tax=Salarias fasciatus TaxID=181472 RepID=UPI0011770C56|nr:protein mono-ADP-ribosyltransferase PARP10 [Salarias fasciatus]